MIDLMGLVVMRERGRSGVVFFTAGIDSSMGWSLV